MEVSFLDIIKWFLWNRNIWIKGPYQWAEDLVTFLTQDEEFREFVWNYWKLIPIQLAQTIWFLSMFPTFIIQSFFIPLCQRPHSSILSEQFFVQNSDQRGWIYILQVSSSNISSELLSLTIWLVMAQIVPSF